jgi:uncharacterized membrane protein
MSPMAATHSVPRTVDDYLRQLRLALAGAPPALIQDALADAEDYLREEVSIEAYKPESEIVARVCRTFGTPEDVAAEYRGVEQRFERRHASPTARRSGGFFGVALDPRTYGGLLYALLALPIGILYFTWVVTGVSLSAGFAILIIGVPFTLLFIASVRMFALLEGRIVELLLGQRMPRRMPSEDDAKGMWPRIGAMLADRRTWSTMFYMILQLPLGIAYFTITVTGLALSLSLIVGPTVELITGQNIIRFGNGWIDRTSETFGGQAIMMVTGFILFFVVLHLLRALTYMHARYAEATLVKV